MTCYTPKVYTASGIEPLSFNVIEVINFQVNNKLVGQGLI
jgi:hypothetical protein